MALHYFDVEVAKRCGVNAAILLSDIQYWCERSKGDPAHLREGRVWMWSSQEAFVQRHPYLSRDTVRESIKRLSDDGLILVMRPLRNGKFWYSPIGENPTTTDGEIPTSDGENPTTGCGNHPTDGENPTTVVGEISLPTTIHYKRERIENTIENNRVYVGGNSNVSPPNVVVRGEMENITHPTIDQVREYARAAGLRVDAEAFVRANAAAGWKDTQGRPIRNWKLWLQGYAAKHPASVGEEWQGHKLEFI